MSGSQEALAQPQGLQSCALLLCGPVKAGLLAIAEVAGQAWICESTRFVDDT